MRGVASPKLDEFLQQANQNIALAKKNNIQLTPALARENLNKLGGLMSESVAVKYIKDKYWQLEDRIIPARVYSPAPKQALPVMVHFHGGGHMCGSIELYDPICRHLAQKANCVVISVDYRLAPEHPYPAGLDDCEYALIHYQELLDEVNHNGTVTIIGDSAGGAICSGLSMRSLSNPRIHIDQQILIYPSVDYTMSSDSIKSNGSGFLLETPRVKWYFQHYFQHNAHDVDYIKQASPLLGPITNKLPRSLVFTAGCDPLRDEGVAYVNALKQAGVAVEHHQLDGMIHAYMLLHDLVEQECLETYLSIAHFMQTKTQ
ncbi:alpha/beta hydrolase [Shewanella sp. Isolate11]|uniref:alpha/beta hydrolase n=1 Tax=Shewanella sp. Isolate11 TaxID=2908530 RepID=UPI001EFD1864|nr:alpha/beta hydrolase [Shewanella sp. Isolate11]MCG9697727.1 alpha/beta hydrolase [Shewanella sp. Isolate11]